MKQKRKKKVDFSLYTNQWDCLLNVPFSEIIIMIIIIIKPKTMEK